MKRLLPLLCLGLFACGTLQDPATPATLDDNPAHQKAMMGLSSSDVSTPSATCVAIVAKLKLQRAALEITPEWKAMIVTDAWQKIESDADAAKANHCSYHDPQPSDACTKVSESFKTDSEALHNTDEYKAAEATKQWQDLKLTYAEARVHDCDVTH